MFSIERNLVQAEQFPEERTFWVEKLLDYEYIPELKPKKYRDMIVKGLGIPSVETSETGLPSVDTNVLIALTQGIIKDFFEQKG